LAYDALCAPLVRHALTGYDCTLVAYGQTGSGKTHTMFGPPGCLVEARVRQWHEESSSSSSSSSDAPRDWGVFPRAVLELMRTPGVRSIRASAVEVYHENVFDLMNARAQLSLGSSRTKFGRRVFGAAESGSDDVAARGGLGGVHPSCCTCHKCFALAEAENKRMRQQREATRIRPTASRTSTSRRSSSDVPGSTLQNQNVRETFATVGETSVPLDTPESLARFARSVEATRTSKSHNLNDRSSRSHCLVRVRAKTASGTFVNVTFVDLAGSERVRRTGATGDKAHEARAINASLSALGRVVKMLSTIHTNHGRRTSSQTQPPTQHKHVPYRDAALTMLLRDAFGGGSVTSVVINVAGEPQHLDETACSLRFGERMCSVRNAPTRVLGDVNENAHHRGVGSPKKIAASSARRDAKIAALQTALEAATAELGALARRGDAGGFVPGGPVTEVRSLKRGMEKLHVLDAEIAELRVRLAEAEGEIRTPSDKNKSRDAKDAEETRKISSLRVALATSSNRAEVLRGVVERQKTIKAIWAEPSVPYARKAAEVRQIRSELEMEES
jgi:hypothetical protein